MKANKRNEESICFPRCLAMLICFLLPEALCAGAPPPAPQNPGAQNVGPDTITWTWQDVSSNETGFRIYDDPGAGPPATLRVTTTADVQEWRHDGLTTNAQYAMQVASANADGDSGKTPVYTTWTLIEPVGGLVFSSVEATSISAAAANALSNPGASSSGLYLANSTAGTDSGWRQNEAPWISDGLTPNTQYLFSGKSRNGGAVETSAVLAAKYTLAGAPSDGNSIACDHAIGQPYPAGAIFTFANPEGFGASAHGGSAYKVSKFKYAWDRWTEHSFTGAETDWSSGSLVMAPPAAGNYFLHLESFNAENAPSGILHYGPFWYDSNPPATPVVSGVTPTRNTRPTWSWTSGGAGNGTFRYQFGATTETWTQTTARSCMPASPLSEGFHTLYVQERDDAGNWSGIGRFSIRIIGAPGPESDWSNTYWDDQFAIPGTNGKVNAVAKDASGAIYIAGLFASVGNVSARNIARMDPATLAWSSLGTGINGEVAALAVDTYGVIYAGGAFTEAGGAPANNVAKWNGTLWAALRSGTEGAVSALVVDGSDVLYAGGAFARAGGRTVNNIARWNGSGWSAMGTGMDDVVRSLAVDASGSVYAGGNFVSAGGTLANYVARWDGSSWYPLGNGMNRYGYVTALTADEVGYVYAGGWFTTAGDVAAYYVAKWDGGVWTALGTGMDYAVNALATSGSGILYAGGAFTIAGGETANSIAMWDGTSWTAAGAGTGGTVNALAVDVARGVYVGGDFNTAGETTARYVARWDGESWLALGPGAGSSINALAVNNSGEFFAGGQFTQSSGTLVYGVSRWSVSSWAPLGTGMDGAAHAVAIDGEDSLFAGGAFTAADGKAASRVARWDGSTWSAMGGGMDDKVYALAVNPAGDVFAGGAFTVANGAPASRVAKWNGASWSAMGAGMNGPVYALAADGAGAVFAGGAFTMAGGTPANNIAKWNGASWSALGAGTNDAVYALALDGFGVLHAGGSFMTAGGIATSSVARWNGASWSPLGMGTNGVVYALAADEAGGLHAGGKFSSADGAAARYIARWNGASWMALASGMNGQVSALAAHRNVLFAGGSFAMAGEKVSANFACWQPRVNRSQFMMTDTPGAVTLGNDAHGFYKPALITSADTTASLAVGLPATIALDRAPEIRVAGLRINGAFTLAPEGLQLAGGSATLRIEFSEDDVTLFNASPADFVAARLTYPADYPANKEAATVERISDAVAAPVRVENGKQIYAFTIPFVPISPAYGAVPRFFLAPPAPPNPSAADVTTDSITWVWQDPYGNETGFKVWAAPGAGVPDTLLTTTPANVTSCTSTGLTPNAQYSCQIAVTNADGDSRRTAISTTWTLAGAPSLGNNIACDLSTSAIYPTSTPLTFSNPAGFGAGKHGGSVYQASKFRFMWDTRPQYAFAGGEAEWTTGALILAPQVGGDYYLHLQSVNEAGADGVGSLDYGPFLIRKAYALDVVSVNPDSGLGVMVTPPDVDSAGDGTTPFRRLYYEGATVSLTVAPNPGYHFLRWAGDAPAGHETDNPLLIPMDADTSLTAICEHDRGGVVVDVTPSSAPWVLLDGSNQVTSGIGPAAITAVNTGLVSLTWQALSGFDAPTTNPMSADLAKDGTVVFIGRYTLDRERVANYLAGRMELDAMQREAADVNRDGLIDAADLLWIIGHVPGR